LRSSCGRAQEGSGFEAGEFQSRRSGPTRGKSAAGSYNFGYIGASELMSTFANSLKHLVGAWRVELQTSCAQGRRASSCKVLAANATTEKQRLNPPESMWLAVSGCVRLVLGWLQN